CEQRDHGSEEQDTHIKRRVAEQSAAAGGKETRQKRPAPTGEQQPQQPAHRNQPQAFSKHLPQQPPAAHPPPPPSRGPPRARLAPDRAQTPCDALWRAPAAGAPHWHKQSTAPPRPCPSAFASAGRTVPATCATVG